MIDFVKKYLPILIIILILFSYLGIKALDENGWDGWGFGSAQTLMSSQYWAKDGFAKNYFLFIPQPYGKLTQYFDNPEFRNQPIETYNGELARDRRLYYTHYPPLYLFPYALIAKTGIEARSVYRIFSLLISLAGLLFFYLFIKSVSNKVIAAIASIYYGFSVTFLNYADAISVQPWDILFIFLILYLNSKEKRQNVLIWLSYFALSLLSYDATFYIFAFLILYDILILKNFFWKRWLIFALAPILGFGLQIIQNIWYLGWHDMLQDFLKAYKTRQLGTIKNFIISLSAPFISMTGIKTLYFFKKTIVTLGSVVLIIGTLWKLRSKLNLNPNFFRIIFVLAGASFIQPLLINVTGGWPFQGILTAAFWGLLIGVSSFCIFEFFKKRFFLNTLEKISIFVLMIVILGLWLFQFNNTRQYMSEWPNNKPDQKIIEFGKTLKTFYPNEEKMAFRIIPQNQIWKSQFATFNMDYYFGMPKIDFANTQDLLIDFWWFRNISEYPFYSFIVAENRTDVEKIREKLAAQNLKNISPVMEIQGQYIFIAGPK